MTHNYSLDEINQNKYMDNKICNITNSMLISNYGNITTNVRMGKERKKEFT